MNWKYDDVKTAMFDFIDRLRFDNGKINRSRIWTTPEKPGESTSPGTTVEALPKGGVQTSTSVRERLQQVMKLLGDGLITPEEAAAKRRAILDDL